MHEHPYFVVSEQKGPTYLSFFTFYSFILYDLFFPCINQSMLGLTLVTWLI